MKTFLVLIMCNVYGVAEFVPHMVDRKVAPKWYTGIWPPYGRPESVPQMVDRNLFPKW